MRSEVSSDALRLLLDVLDGGRDGFTSDEVDQAAQFLVLTAPSRYATADTIADEAASLSYDGLDTEFTSRNLGEVARMDADRAGRHTGSSWTGDGRSSSWATRLASWPTSGPSVAAT